MLVAEIPTTGDRSSPRTFCHVKLRMLSLLSTSAAALRALACTPQYSKIRFRRSEWPRWKQMGVDDVVGNDVTISSITLITSASLSARSRASAVTMSKSTSPYMSGWPPSWRSRKMLPKEKERWTTGPADTRARDLAWPMTRSKGSWSTVPFWSSSRTELGP